MKDCPLRTTVIGSYPFPSWLEHARSRLDSFGPEDIREMQDDAVLSRARENGVPIVEANVGKTLLISKGEIVKISSAETTVTIGTVAIPAAPSPLNRSRQEKEFLRWREMEMKKRYQTTRKKMLRASTPKSKK